MLFENEENVELWPEATSLPKKKKKQLGFLITIRYECCFFSPSDKGRQT